LAYGDFSHVITVGPRDPAVGAGFWLKFAAGLP